MNTSDTELRERASCLAIAFLVLLAPHAHAQEQHRQIFIGFEDKSVSASERYQQCHRLVKKLEAISGVERVLSVTPNERALQMLEDPTTAGPVLDFAGPALVSADGAGLGVSCILAEEPTTWPAVIDAVRATVTAEIPSAWVTGFCWIRIEAKKRLLGIALWMNVGIGLAAAALFSWRTRWALSIVFLLIAFAAPAISQSLFAVWSLLLPVMLVGMAIGCGSLRRRGDTVDRAPSELRRSTIVLVVILAAAGIFAAWRLQWAAGPLRALPATHEIVGNLRELDQRFTTRNITVLCPAGEQITWDDYDNGTALADGLPTNPFVVTVKGAHNLIDLSGGVGMRAVMPAHTLLGAVRMLSPGVVSRYLPGEGDVRRMRFDVYLRNDISMEALLDLEPALRTDVARHLELSAESVEMLAPMLTEAHALHPATWRAKWAASLVIGGTLLMCVAVGWRGGSLPTALTWWGLTFVPTLAYVLVIAWWDGTLTYPRVLLIFYLASIGFWSGATRLFGSSGGGALRWTLLTVFVPLAGYAIYGVYLGQLAQTELWALVVAAATALLCVPQPAARSKNSAASDDVAQREVSTS